MTAADSAPGDAVLVERARAGDRAALGLLVRRHRASVYRFARALVHDDAVAEDLLQDTFITAAAQLAQLREGAALRPWLFTITRSKAARLRRAARPTEDLESLEAVAVDAGFGCETPEAVASRVEHSALLERALGRLEHLEREVLVLRDLEGLSGEETAAALGVGVAAMKSRLHRARLHLVGALKKEGLTP